MKRSGKFYRKNEREVMESLGLKPTKNSGSGFEEKEDGQSEYLICQLKSTDASSIRIQQKDIRTLVYNATVSHKIPIFAIQFLNTGEVWLMAKPVDFTSVAQYLELGYIKSNSMDLGINLDNFVEQLESKNTKKIRSSKSAREEYNKEQGQKYIKFKSAK